MKRRCLLLVWVLTLSACGMVWPVNLASKGSTREIAPTPPTLVLDTRFYHLMDGLLADGDVNACVSPLSFKFALAMAYNGAAGETVELLSSLFDAPPDAVNDWAMAMLAQAKPYDGKQKDLYTAPNPELRIANAYWLRRGLEREIAKAFTSTLESSYHAESGTFDKKPDPINKWVSDATHGQIKDILTEVDPAALSYLVNALYFKAQWVNDFNEHRTASGTFTNSDGSTVMTDMLHGGADGYIDTARFEGMTKYLRGRFAFTAVMPRTDDEVTLEDLLEAQAAVQDDYTAIQLTLPKFDFDTAVDFKVGRHPAFDALFAPYGMNGALSANAKTEDLFISEIIHKTTFTLGEAGIEASAATVVAMAGGSAAMPDVKEVAIVFDKPFYFTLTDRDGEVVFVGKVMAL